MAFLGERLGEAISGHFLGVDVADFNDAGLDLTAKVVIVNSDVFCARAKDSIFSKLDSGFVVIVDGDRGAYDVPKLSKEVANLEDFLYALGDAVVLGFLSGFAHTLV